MKLKFFNFVNLKILGLALLFLFLAAIRKIRQKDRRIKLLEKKRDELDRLCKNLEKNICEQNITEEQKEVIDTLQQKLNEKDGEFRELEEKNVELRKEASKYQSELGAATNIRLGDEDSVKFKQDIVDLQKTL